MHLKNLKKLIYTYCDINKKDYLIEEFSNGENLLNSNNDYILIFTEYYLNGINGFEMAKLLRKKGCKSKIIFTSHNTDFLFESFKEFHHIHSFLL